MKAPGSIFIINPFGIGDVLFSTPLIRALRRAFPESRIGYLCNRRTERILRNNPHLDAMVVYEKDEFVLQWNASRRGGFKLFWQLLRQIKRLRPDLVIDLSLGERYSMILMLLGIPRRVGFNYRGRGRFLTESLTIDGYHGRHVVSYYQRLLRFLGIALPEESLELHVPDEDRAWADRWLNEQGLMGHYPLVGIIPAGGVSWGGAASFRRWSAEGFAKVGDALAEHHGAKIVLFGEKADADSCRMVSKLMHHPTVDASGQTNLGQFISLLSRLHIVICNDGGPLHLAVSQGIKTVSMFGPVDPRVYGPYPFNENQHRVVFRNDLPCRPCYHRFRLPPCPYERACLTSISPEDVLDACEELLKRAN